MIQVKNVMLVLVTLALAAAGAAMPFAASRVQDARQAGAETRSFDSFMLTLEKKSELSRILRFLTEAEYYYQENIGDEREKARLSESEALDAAKEAVVLLSKYELISRETMNAVIDPKAAGIGEPAVYMLRITSETKASAYITWMIYWEKLDIQIYLDDASGKAYRIIVSDENWYFFGEHYNDNTASTGKPTEDYYAQLEKWGQFLEEYYEVKFQAIEELPDSFGLNCLLFIDLEDGGDWLPMGLHLLNDFAYLGPEYIG